MKVLSFECIIKVDGSLFPVTKYEELVENIIKNVILMKRHLM